MSSKSLILVTGVSGFLGSHVVDLLVKDGYRVRGTVRAAKVAANKEAYAPYGGAVEVYAMDDLIGGQYPDAFVGVEGVIHTAAPLTGKAKSAEEAINVAVDGSLNIFRQAEKAGIRKFSYASSIISHGGGWLKGDYTPLADDKWLPASKEEILKNKDADVLTVYAVEKTLGERAVWEFADQHPHVEVTTLEPPFFFGPFAPGYKSPYQSAVLANTTFSTMVLLYNMIKRDGRPALPFFVDVRDVARALIAGLASPPTAQVGRKRILISSHWVDAAELVAFLTRERPQLAGRINEAFKRFPPGVKNVIDNKRLKEVLGVEVRPWQETILEGVDALLDLETVWAKNGWTPTYPDTPPAIPAPGK